MKKHRNTLWIASGVLSIACFVGLKFAHAQEAGTSLQDGTISTTDTNMNWSSLSDAEVELRAIESIPPIPFATLSANDWTVGTFWSAQHSPLSLEPWPPFPADLRQSPVWSMGTEDQGGGVFLLDDLNVNYNKSVASTATVQSNGMMQPLDDGPPGPPGPPGGGTNNDGGSTNGVPLIKFPPINTNGLWLEIIGVTNGLANLILHRTTNGIEYEILSQPELGDGTNVADWNSEGVFWGNATTNWTAVAVSINGNTNLFFDARSWQDSTGSGIPDWWWLKYFGQDTNVDAYADPDGDGWNNLQEFQNGTDPTIFNTHLRHRD